LAALGAVARQCHIAAAEHRFYQIWSQLCPSLADSSLAAL
jgi:hypothetical protein